MNKGWIKLHRSIQDCSIWLDNQPFDRRSAWIDLLLSSNHSDKEILFNGSPMTINRGQYLTSVRQLSAKWQWSKDRVLKFLKTLEKLGMIHKDSDNFRTLITIENYGLYQDEQDTDKDANKYTIKDSDKDTDTPQTRMKECKNVKNERNIYSPVIKEVIEYLNQVSGKNYKTDTAKSVSCIKARINEGFTRDDFKKVIDIKCGQWMQNEKMKAYIRPETLFGNKFEGYLNEKGGVDDEPSGTSYVEFTEEQYRAAKEAGYGLSGVQW